MQTVVNRHQMEAWNGYEGRHWAENQERYERCNGAANVPLLNAATLAPEDRVLDIGCGAGKTTRLAAEIAHRGWATGIDLSAPMLDRARLNASREGLANLDFIQGDAQIYPLPAASLDVAISRFGVMFFDDPVAAFENIGRALRPGGRLAFVSLGAMDSSNQMMVPFLSIGEFLPEPEADAESDSHSGPGSLSDPKQTRSILEQAGYSEIRIEPLTIPMIFGNDAEDAAAFILEWGPVVHQLTGAGITDVSLVRAVIAEALEPFQTEEGVRLMGDHWLTTARRNR